jgi:hypothetical protein
VCLCMVFFVLFLYFFGTGSACVAQVGLELMILLS